MLPRYLTHTLPAALLMAVGIDTFVITPYVIPSESMEPTIDVHSVVIATNWNYGYSAASLPLGSADPENKRFLGSVPDRGDIITFRWNEFQGHELIKRVIGLPGDTVSVKNDIPVINGKPAQTWKTDRKIKCSPEFKEHECDIYEEILPGNTEKENIALDPSAPSAHFNMKEIKIPAGYIFVMGDNRDNSLDSRFSHNEKIPGADLVPLSRVTSRYLTSF